MASDSSARRPSEFSDKDLSEYAMTYVAAYTGTVEVENPQHWPIFAKAGPYAIEVCRMPNGSVCILFDRAEKQSITVTQRDWSYLESKVLSGLSHLVTVYPHETISPSAAISRGKRDAMRDIRSLETSDFAVAADQISKLLDELSEVSQTARGPVKKAELVLQKLAPIRDKLMRSGPTQDMLAMIDSLKGFPAGQPGASSAVPEALDSLVKELGDLAELMKKVEAQEARIAEIEGRLVKEIMDLKTNLDRRVGRALGMIMTSTDHRVDKAIATLKEMASKGAPATETQAPLAELEELRRQVGVLAAKVQQHLESPPATTPEPSGRELADINAALGNLRLRVQRIEDYLVSLSRARSAIRP